MAVTINTLGSNSRQIVIDGEASAANIIAAVETSLTALGWTLYDTVTSGSRNMFVTKVYSAANIDAVTTKYMIIRYDAIRQYWFTSCCESWNTITHVATNESWYGGRQILLPLQYSNCVLYVFANIRYAMFMGAVRSEPGPWQGVFEFEREAAEDIADKTVPCFGWTSSLTIGEPYGNMASYSSGSPVGTATSAANGSVAAGFSVPRTRAGLTGRTAVNTFNITTGFGPFPPNASHVGQSFSAGGITRTLNNHHGMLGDFGVGSSYVWDANKTVVSSLKLSGFSSGYVAGRIFGVKTAGKIGTVLDTTTVPIDANKFFNPAGTNTPHYLMGIHGGYHDTLAVGSNRVQAETITNPDALGITKNSCCVSGRFIYFTTTSGLHKFDLSTNTFVLNVLPAGEYWNLAFDGENSLYVTATATDTNNLYKINLTNDTYTTISLTGIYSGIVLDDDNAYVGSRVTTGATTTVKKVDRTTFAETASYSVATGGNGITHMSTADYSGYLYIGTLMTTSGAGSTRITRILVSSAAQAAITPTVSMTVNTIAIGGVNPMFFDGSKLYFTMLVNGGGNASLLKCNVINISNFSLDGEFFASNSVGASTQLFNSTGYNYGSVEPPSWAGMQLMPVASGFNLRVIYSDPRSQLVLNAMLFYNFQTFETAVFPFSYATDHCSLYAMASQTTFKKYTGAFRNYNFLGTQTANLLIPI